MGNLGNLTIPLLLAGAFWITEKRKTKRTGKAAIGLAAGFALQHFGPQLLRSARLG